jgi:heme exporter protein C
MTEKLNKNGNWLSVLAAAWAVSLVLSLFMIFFYAPVDANMGIVQKIFYVHLGAAAAMGVSVIVAFVFSIIYLAKGSPRADIVASSGAQTAVLFGTIVLITGMIWAKRAWGALLPLGEIKLLLFLLLWVVFVVYLILRAGLETQHKRAAGSAIFAIMGFLMVPFVIFATRWFNFGEQLHPNVIHAQNAGMPVEMLITLAVSVASWAIASVVLTALTARIRLIEYELKRAMSRVP